MGRRDPLPDSLDVKTQALSYFKVDTVYPSLRDRRDYTRRARALTIAALPPEWEVPEDEEENQGNTGACGAFTVVQALEHEYLRQGRDIEFSPLFQYLLTLNEQRTLCQDFGSFMRTAFSIPVSSGAIPEAMMPYGSRNLCILPEPHYMAAAAAERGAWRYAQYVKAGPSLQDMMALAYGTNGTDGHLPAVCFQVYQNFQPDEQGNIPMPEGAVQGGHAVLFAGWSMARRRVKIKNHWTRNWGVNGYAWLSMDLFGRDPNQGGIWLDDAYALDITLAAQPEPQPEPEDAMGFSEGYAACREEVVAFMQESTAFYEGLPPNEKRRFAAEVCAWHAGYFKNLLPPRAQAAANRPVDADAPSFSGLTFGGVR